MYTSGRALAALQEALAALPRLAALTASGYRIRAVPGDWGVLRGSLAALLLDGNALEAFPSSLEGLSALALLDLDRNRMAAVALAAHGALPRLHTLTMADNGAREWNMDGAGARGGCGAGATGSRRGPPGSPTARASPSSPSPATTSPTPPPPWAACAA